MTPNSKLLRLPHAREPSWTDERERYVAIARSIEPAAYLTTKDSWFWTAAWVTLVVVITLATLGIGTYFFVRKMSLRTFLEDYGTTLGPLQGYGRKLRALSRRLLVHECRHTLQTIFLGWFVPILGWIPVRRWRAWVGLLPMGILYILPYFRYRLELDADREAWRWSLRNGYSVVEVRRRSAAFARMVGGGQYFWAWIPSLVRRGFRIEVEKVVATFLEEAKAD